MNGRVGYDPVRRPFRFREFVTMRIPLSAGLAVLLLSGPVLAQQPPAIPMRGQSVAQKSIDNAACYGTANQQTKVVMARESQAPQKPKPLGTVPVHQVAVSAPLPPGMPAASAPPGAAASGAASTVPMAGASGASGTLDASASSVPVKGPLPGMPALPPPEPPMVQYWRAYSDCMTQRGYSTQ
jgi:hypothetical protein